MKTLMTTWAFALSLIFSPLAVASIEGIDQDKLNDYTITGFSRPCCAFSLNYINKKMGLAQVLNGSNLGPHDFGRFNKVKDTVGMIYSCKAGFLDIAHLRDNADWSAHIYFNLDKWLGSGEEVLARREGGFKKRAVFFPKVSKEDLASLTEDDKEKLAVAIGFSMALLHEIPTTFKIPVSQPSAFVISEQSSAFSVEDAYSNLLGNVLGAKAARDARPFNIALESLLQDKLDELQAQPEANTQYAYDSVKNLWWKKGLMSSLRTVLKRNYDYKDEINPELVVDLPFCSNEKAQKLEVPFELSNGKTVDDYYEIQAEMKRVLKRSFKKAGIDLGKKTFDQTDYQEIIEGLEVYLEKKLSKFK